MNKEITMRDIKALLFFIAISLADCTDKPAINKVVDSDKIDATVKSLMEKENVEGMALALIENGQITHVKAYGLRNVEKYLPLTADTIMYGASLTKTVFAYFVLQLVNEGKCKLDERYILEQEGSQRVI